ncbi:hypothetical protein FLA_4348 [Filimonas lacunae]|nr:hypothetical protein FLA_4348 [Filimonas lacunae]
MVSSYGQATEKIDIVSTAVPFLRISPDARAGGMGETGVSTSPNANSQFYNVAKYAFVHDLSGVSATYTPWLKDLGLKDVYLASVAGYYKPGEEQAFSASLRYFSLGNIEISDADGNDLGHQKSSELGFDLGYSRKLTANLSVGAALRYIYSNLAGTVSTTGSMYKAGNAFAADLGVYYNKVDEAGEGWHAGAALTNLGSKIGYTNDATQKNYLPANLALGAGYSWVFNEVHKISLHGEINKLMVPKLPDASDSAAYAKYGSEGSLSGLFKSFGNSAMAYSIGSEYVYNRLYALRLGYYTDSRSMGKRNYLTAGVGINYSMFGVNFSYLVPSGSGVTRNPLSNTLRFSLLFYMSKEAK